MKSASLLMAIASIFSISSFAQKPATSVAPGLGGGNEEATISKVQKPQPETITPGVELPPASGVGKKPTLQSPLLCEDGLLYIPLPAFEASNLSRLDSNLKRETVAWDKVSASRHAQLPNISMQIASKNLAASVNIPAGLDGKGQKKQITIDFMKYRTEPIFEAKDDTQPFMYARIGVGIRLTIQVETLDTNIGGSLLALAGSVKAGRTAGSLSVEIIGMDAQVATLAVPFTTDLSDGSIQKVIEAIAVIKSKLYETATNITPQFIARVSCAPQPELPKPEKKWGRNND